MLQPPNLSEKSHFCRLSTMKLLKIKSENQSFFFKKNFYRIKRPRRSQKSRSEVSKLTFAQKKTYFRYKIRRWQNFEKNGVAHWRKLVSISLNLFRKINSNHEVKNQGNNLAIFGRFLNLLDFFFKSRV